MAEETAGQAVLEEMEEPDMAADSISEALPMAEEEPKISALELLLAMKEGPKEEEAEDSAQADSDIMQAHEQISDQEPEAKLQGQVEPEGYDEEPAEQEDYLDKLLKGME